ncbi:Kinesin heavy chain [Diplonema papillatum]|nr:Kinesin heavy chain [Diplonema papillatum]
MTDKPPDDNIKVVARFRPMNRTELELGGKEVLTMPDSKNVSIQPLDQNGQGQASHKFTFDAVFGAKSKQPEIYEVVGKPVVADIFKGYNGTIFVYGQTGAGKSHSMMGPSTGGFCSDKEQQGIIPRVVEQIFLNVENSDPDIEFSIKVSYVEIYMEKIRDLFEPKESNLQLREDIKGGRGVYIAGAVEQYVADPQEIFDLMRLGGSNRAMAATAMNDTSSRSHAIFSIMITQKHSVKLDQKTGKLYLVDLAGSEKVGKTKAEGQQLEEAKLINKSLSALGQVINALTDKKTTHIPYRDSKLTRLLQDSLGGNSRTSLIICGSMSEYNQWETLSTLRFGQRAKSIKNNAKINRELTVGEYKILLAQMEKELAALRSGKGLPAQSVIGDRDTAADTAKLQAELQEERENMMNEKADLMNELQELREMDTVKTSLLEHYRADLQLYQDESDEWSAEYDELLKKLEELQTLFEKEKKTAGDTISVVTAAVDSINDIGKDAFALTDKLQKVSAHAEQVNVNTTGNLDDEQEREVIGWRRERELSRKEEDIFRENLLKKIEMVRAVDQQLVNSNAGRMKEVASELSALRRGWAHVADPTFVGPTPAAASRDPDAMDQEIKMLKQALSQAKSGDVVPRAELEVVRKALEADLADKTGLIAKLNHEKDRYVSETKELRSSLLRDLQSRCEKVIDLEMSLDEVRDQYKNLMVASSNKMLRQRVQMLEAKNTEQTDNMAEIMNETSTLRLEFRLAEKKLAIRNERIENLKTGLKEEKRHMKELREAAQQERHKLKHEAARIKEELNFWKDKCLKSASAASAASASNAAASKAGRIIKVLKGGQHKEGSFSSSYRGDDDVPSTA